LTGSFPFCLDFRKSRYNEELYSDIPESLL
jgi:hypothetical protein